MAPRAPRGYFLVNSEAARLVARAIENRFLATLHGAEHLPRSGGALLVGNHAYVGVDSWVLSALLLSQCNIVPRFLGDRNLWRIPIVNRFLTGVGAIPGKPEDAVALLEAGELVAVYPGGIDDSFKLSSEAYTLKWQSRAGFARVAMRARVPIIPVAATGVDELYQLDAREPFLGRAFGGSSKYDVPLPKSLKPRRVPLDYYLLEPIDTSGDPNNGADVERVRQATENAIRSVLDPYRERLKQAPASPIE
jgi:1-acyl-sn-glycerol-3-phosphate acyltransferase